MKKVHILYNPKSGGNCGEEGTKKLEGIIKDGEIVYIDITKIKDYSTVFSSVAPGDDIIVSGGDGTLSRFASDVYDIDIKNPVYYFATGTGNDFMTDMNREKGDAPVLINEYLKNLPLVIVNGKKARFINAIGFGIDGYACEVGDKLRSLGKKINYTSIVIKGLLYAYKPRRATVIVDGVEHHFKRVWFAPTMKGRFYGGGINMNPNQTRDKKTVSAVIIHKAFNFILLPILPTAFKGEHLKYKKFVTVLDGRDITVKFDKPSPLQIDGETILDVSEYSVKL